MSSQSPPVPNASAPNTYLEQYKAYLADLGNVGSRYATIHGFYMSVISALLGLLALTESGKVFNQVQRSTLTVVCLFSIVLCWVWSLTISFYGELFRAKFHVLGELEKHLSHPCFAEEYQAMKDRRLWLSSVQRFVPLILMVFFLVLAIIPCM